MNSVLLTGEKTSLVLQALPSAWESDDDILHIIKVILPYLFDLAPDLE